MFLFKCYGDRRDLHSYPTRRSSDLALEPTGDEGRLAERTLDVLSAVLAPVSRDDLTASLEDRKSTRLNSSHVEISYAVFCLKKKNNTNSDYNLSTVISIASILPTVL